MPDSTPNYLTTDAQGNVGAEFSGRIKALGVELPALTDTAASPVNNRVVWVSTSKGVVAQLVAADDTAKGTSGLRTILSHLFDGTNPASTVLHAGTVLSNGYPNTADGAFIEANRDAGGVARVRTAAFSGGTKIVTDQSDRSSFVLDGGGLRRIRLYGPWTQANSLPVGPSGSIAAYIDVGSAMSTGNYVVLGYLVGSAGANQVIWAVYDTAGGNIIRFHFTNWYSGAAATFTFGFIILSFG